MCVLTQPQTCLRVHLSVCNSVYSEERLGGTEGWGGREQEREGGRAVEGFRGKMWSSIAGSRPREKIIGW